LKNLRTFLKEINDEIIEFKEPLSRQYEIAAALRKFDGGKAVLVKEKETGVTVIGGVNGNRARLLRSIGVTQETLYPTLVDATKNPLKCEVSDGPVKEVLEKGNLNDIPVLTHFKGDPGPYITSGILHTKGQRVNRRMSVSIDSLFWIINGWRSGLCLDISIELLNWHGKRV